MWKISDLYYLKYLFVTLWQQFQSGCDQIRVQSHECHLLRTPLPLSRDRPTYITLYYPHTVYSWPFTVKKDDVTAIMPHLSAISAKNFLRVCSSSARTSLSLCWVWNALKENLENQIQKGNATTNFHAAYQCLLPRPCTPASNIMNVKRCTRRKSSGSTGCGTRLSCLLFLKHICLWHKRHHVNIRHTYGATPLFMSFLYTVAATWKHGSHFNDLSLSFNFQNSPRPLLTWVTMLVCMHD